MGTEWFYEQSGQQFGPLTSAQLKQLAESGSVDRKALVWRRGDQKKVPATTVKGMFPDVATHNALELSGIGKQPTVPASPQPAQHAPLLAQRVTVQNVPHPPPAPKLPPALPPESLIPSQVFVHKDGQQSGPFTLNNINDHLANGTLDPGDMAWYEGVANWVPLAAVPGVRMRSSPPAMVSESPALKAELKILEQTTNVINSLIDSLVEASAEDSQELQRDIEQKLVVYRRQIESFKKRFPDYDAVPWYEAQVHSFHAATKFNSSGYWRKSYERSDGLVGRLTTGFLAHKQEEHNAREALKLLDKAIAIFDTASKRLFKALIYRSLKQNQDALRELNYVIEYFSDDEESYIEARQRKDEIEASLKRK